jgi:hypothetical protein
MYRALRDIDCNATSLFLLAFAITSFFQMPCIQFPYENKADTMYHRRKRIDRGFETDGWDA